jgi:hypothetical protein
LRAEVFLILFRDMIRVPKWSSTRP